MPKGSGNKSHLASTRLLNGVITNPRVWATSAGWDFHFNPSSITNFTTMASTVDGLSGYGWTVSTTLAPTYASDSTADFLSTSDEAFQYLRVSGDAGGNAAFVKSPCIFGSYAHAAQAAVFLGYFPTYLNLEARVSYRGNVPNAFLGFGGLSAVNSTDASIVVAGAPANTPASGINIVSAGTSVVDTWIGADTAWKTWKFRISTSNLDYALDSAAFDVPVAITTNDKFPVSFIFSGGTTNASDTLGMKRARIWYS